MDESTLAWIEIAHLARARTAPWFALARRFGGARALLAAPDEALRRAGCGAAALRRLRAASLARAGRVVERAARLGIDVLCVDACDYPRQLLAIADPPPVLYARGRPLAELEPRIAVVGSRRASEYGLRAAEQFGRDLAAAGAVVVSGLAFGVDAAAHRGALEFGSGVAVLAGGVDRPSPRSQRALAERLVSQGALVSEHPPGVEPRPYYFPARNRILVGLARALLVIEATQASGSLTSAAHAADQGKEVLALPGSIFSAASAGTNGLLRDGCRPALEVADVLAAAGLPARLPGAIPSVGACAAGGEVSTGEGLLLACLGTDALDIDELVNRSGLDGAKVMEFLTALELAGRVKQFPGALFAVTTPNR